jgi:hypothetical protein
METPLIIIQKVRSMEWKYIETKSRVCGFAAELANFEE